MLPECLRRDYPIQVNHRRLHTYRKVRSVAGILVLFVRNLVTSMDIYMADYDHETPQMTQIYIQRMLDIRNQSQDAATT